MSIDGIQPLTVEQFFNIPDGTPVTNHGGDQCVALANEYSEGVYGAPFTRVDSAFQWWDDFASEPGLVANFVQVKDNPKAGDIFIARFGEYQAENGHIGVVIRDWNGSTFGTMEQNTGSGYRRWVSRHDRTMANMLGFLRPVHNTTPSGDDHDMPRSQYFSATSASPSGVVSAGEWWVRPTPGAPLLRISAGQAHDQFAMDGLDYNSPNVFSKDGSWFDLAFAEDNDAHAQSEKAHPWMVETAGGIDPAAIATAVTEHLGNVNINVDALSQAIADKLNGHASNAHVTTKAEIVSAIEQNYPES